MIALVQKVSQAKVQVARETVGSIGEGFLVLLGISKDDNEEEAGKLARKVAALRILSDGEGKLNLSLKDTGGAVLCVSQFTLYADCRRGLRPSFSQAASGEVAWPLYQFFLAALRQEGVPVEEGKFGAHMEVELVNDGPVTIILDSREI